jgi:predicted phage terminase large subunit-like protein
MPVGLPAFRRLVCSWDTAFKAKTTSDFVAGQVWGIAGADRYLLRSFHARVTLEETRRAMLELREWALAFWPRVPLTVLIEKSANGIEILESLKREVPGVLGVSVSVDKVLRAEAASSDLESGNVFVPGEEGPAGLGPTSKHAWVLDLIEECAVFPNAAHDDQVDALTQAINWARARPSAPTRFSSPAAIRIPRPLSLSLPTAAGGSTARRRA